MQWSRLGLINPTGRIHGLNGLLRWSIAILVAVTAAASVHAQLVPHLPEESFDYAGIVLPDHYRFSNFPGGRRTGGAAVDHDNTPTGNAVTNPGATLGRVLFYDKTLSANGTTSCSSCHLQEHGFADPRRRSTGFEGGLTRRHSMSLTNARFYREGKFFWDERAVTLEDQVLMPFQDPVEMGLTLDQLETLVRSQSYYPALFEAAFGSPRVDSDRIARALAQFVRSIVSLDSKYDRGRIQVANPQADFPNFSTLENEGKRIFMTNGGVGRAPCTVCHNTESFSLINPAANRNRRTDASNNGLDAVSIADRGVAETTNNDRDTGEFKSPSLRNVGVGAPYMHDGRFATLEEVVDHYSSGMQAHSNLAVALRTSNGEPRHYSFSVRERAALVAFLHTLTDDTLLTDVKFSDPFVDPQLPVITQVTASVMPLLTISDHAWVAITGRNLAESTLAWAGSTSGDTGFPHSLGGVRVTINAEPAQIGSASPSQILVLAPTSTLLSNVEVRLTNPLGTSGIMTSIRPEAPPAAPQSSIAASQPSRAAATTWIGTAQGWFFRVVVPSAGLERWFPRWRTRASRLAG